MVKTEEEIFNEVWDILIDTFEEAGYEDVWPDEELREVVNHILVATGVVKL